MGGGSIGFHIQRNGLKCEEPTTNLSETGLNSPVLSSCCTGEPELHLTTIMTCMTCATLNRLFVAVVLNRNVTALSGITDICCKA